ncbi:MAG: hypothetical protein KF760_34600 [Candidatus Eremiobacteraeota bacterium]|nr:hypothetical protein [Candidatus Eremiobacteraeota bacterium]
MRKLNRQLANALRPLAFRARGKRTWTLELLKNERDIQAGLRQKHEFDESRWKVVKDSLLSDTAGKCAYCEAPTTVVAYGDVEHFRPKSVYWWLAYTYENYLASCQLCNQKFKKDNFPILNQPMAPPGPPLRGDMTDAQLQNLHDQVFLDFADPVQMAVFVASHQVERPLLPNPYLDEPDDYFAYRVDHVLKEVELVAVPGAQAYLDAAVRYYGLNRSELNQLRYNLVYRPYRLAVSVLDDPHFTGTQAWQEATRLVTESCARQAPFSGMICYFERVRASGGQLP